MRYRRAERCLSRAQAALEAGLEEDARAALAEARTLNPDTPELESMRAAVLERRAAATAALRRERARRAGVVALASIVVLVAAVVMWPTTGRREATPASVQAAQASPLPGTPPRIAAQSVTAPPAEPAPLSSGDAKAGLSSPGEASKPSGSAAAGGESPTAVESPAPRNASPEPPVPLPAANAFATSASAETRLPAVEKVDPEVRIPPPTTETTSVAVAPPAANGAERLVGDLPAAAMAIPRTPPPPPAPAPPDPRTLDEPQVRAVLAQFEAAYNNLSADAAQAVWPGVDRRSLARAFESLESQRVALGGCSIEISGATASADCSGTAAWTPKVGGRRHSEARRWQFELAKTGGGWHIERAQAR